MELRPKRQRPRSNPLAPIKRRRQEITAKEPATKSALKILRRDIWGHVLSFLDFNTYARVVPLVNSFFYQLSKDCMGRVDHLELELHFLRPKGMKHDCKKEGEYLKPYASLMQRAFNLEKLKLHCKNSNERPSLRCYNQYHNGFSDIFPKMPWCQTLRVLDLSMLTYNAVLIKDVLKSLTSLEVLKLTLSAPFPKALYYLFTKFVDPEPTQTTNSSFEIKTSEDFSLTQASCKFIPLKELHLRYFFSYSVSIGNFDIFESLDKNTRLEKFSLEFPSLISIENSLKPKLYSNSSLVSLKLSNAFQFNYQSAAEFCGYLYGNKVLKKLCVSKTILRAMNEFFEVLKTNRTLRSLSLEPWCDYSDFDLDIETFVELMQAVGKSSLSSFKASTRAFIVQPRHFSFINHSLETVPDYILTKDSRKFMKGLTNMLDGNPNILHLSLGVDAMPKEQLLDFADIIIYHLKHSNLQTFNKCPIRRIYENSLHTFIVKPKNKFIHTSGNNELLYAGDLLILSILISKIMDRCTSLRMIQIEDSKFVTNSVLTQGNIDIDKIRTKIQTTKKFNFAEELEAIPAVAVLLVLLSLKSSSHLEELSLVKCECTCLHLVIGEILSTLPNLKQLRLEDIPLMQNPISYKFIYDVLYNTRLESFLVSGNSFTVNEYNNIFELLCSQKQMKRLSLSRMFLISKFGMQNNSIEDLLRHSKLEELNLSASSFTVNSLIMLAQGLKSNTTLKSLVMKNIMLTTGDTFSYENVRGTDFSMWTRKVECMKDLILALSASPIIEVVKVEFGDTPTSKFSIEDQMVESFLEHLRILFSNNHSLRIFNFVFPIPPNHLFRYSSILLNYILNPQNQIKKLNKFNVRSLINNTARTITVKHYQSNYEALGGLLRGNRKGFIYNQAHLGTISTHMPVVLSHLLKHYASKVTQVKFYTKKVSCKTLLNKNKTHKSLDLGTLFQECQPPDMTFMLNCLSVHKFTKTLTFFSVTLQSLDFEILEENLPLMPKLSEILFQNVKGTDSPKLGALLSNPNLKTMVLSEVDFSEYKIESFFERLASHNSLEYLSLHETSLNKSGFPDFYFSKLLEALKNNQQLQKLEVSETSQIQASLLAKSLCSHPRLSSVSMPVSNFDSKDFSEFLPLIDNFCSKNHPLSHLHLSKFHWNVQKLYKKGTLDLSNCKLLPFDLLVIIQMIEKSTFPNLKVLKLSYNKDLFAAEEVTQVFAKVVENHSIDSLMLLDTKLQQFPDELLERFIKSVTCFAKHLKLGWNFTIEQILIVLKAATQSSKLNQLDFSKKPNLNELAKYLGKEKTIWQQKGNKLIKLRNFN